MNQQEVMEALLGRVTSSREGVARFSAHEMQQWPPEAVQALKAQQLLKRSRDIHTALCDGCEEACVLPVQSVRNHAGEMVSFLLCTLRSDTNRVIVNRPKLRQWRSCVERICDFISDNLGIHRSSTQPKEPQQLWPVGLFRGKKRGQMLMVRLGSPLELIAGDQSLPLLELIDFEDGEFRVNRTMVAQLVDHSTTVDERYTPSITRREARKMETSDMYEQWQKEYRALKRSKPHMGDVWYSKQIAKMKCARGRSDGTIKKNMK